ncbi:Hydrogen dehydrogenase [uncultured Desulfobacterium sp.]|uniref:Hydrogen dehydrogenase n=1 Tax=uncultured Desulfobacterium sp. TaxID=201089 RepID=A0A445N2S2_9BACT|nr:Hydrogen dehydrogenase [uncultured Desulfobacterium sp.]
MNKTIKLDYLARVEGEGGLTVRLKGDEVVDARLNIFEPPRFFEAFLRGRRFSEAPDITARICGICPIAYMMSSIQAMETGFGYHVDGMLRELRRLIYFGEWIESHALHIYMLHAPDFLGYQDVIKLAGDFPEIVERGLKLKKLGNDIMTLIGGREIHPINIRVGGFYRVPTKNELNSLSDRIKWAREAALETVRWVATMEFPDFEQDYEFVALRHPEEYAVIEGDLASNKGLSFPISAFEEYIREDHVKHSTSLQASVRGRGAYCVGPMARININFEKLSALAREAASEVKFGPGCLNPFKSIIARAIEVVHACDESLRIIEGYQMPEMPSIDLTPRTATCYGCTEAPRGICWHRYRVDEDGTILDARIVPPTSQNQRAIEDDLLHFVRKNMALPEDRLAWLCEQVVRNYDPCISCSCHYLKLKFERDLDGDI